MAKCSQCGASADRLRILADWLDLKDAGEGNDNHEVQRDLRIWATRIEAAAPNARTPTDAEVIALVRSIIADLRAPAASTAQPDAPQAGKADS